MIDLPVTNPGVRIARHRPRIEEALLGVLDSGSYILGEQVERFEAEFASYVGVARATGVASGTDAIELALRACGVGAGDLVFTVSNTAVATVVGIERAGAVPVLCDVEPGTLNLDARSLEAVVQASQRDPLRRLGAAKAVVAVHLYGGPADMDSIVEVAKSHGLLIIEDCAQAHGARIDGRAVGTFGSASAFSFYPTKNLGCLGDGGAVVADDDSITDRARTLRQYGWRERYVSNEPGINSRLDELQASVLRVLLPSLDAANEHRRRMAELYVEGLQGLAGISTLATVKPETHHVYHQFVIRCRDRARLRTHLAEQGIGTGILYPVPIHQQPAYKGRIAAPDPLLHTEDASREILSLPMGDHVEAREVDRVVDAIRSGTS